MRPKATMDGRFKTTTNPGGRLGGLAIARSSGTSNNLPGILPKSVLGLVCARLDQPNPVRVFSHRASFQDSPDWDKMPKPWRRRRRG
jgi:hypothetical protein